MSTSTQIIATDQVMGSLALQSAPTERCVSFDCIRLTSLDAMLAIVSDDDDDSLYELKRKSPSSDDSSSRKRRRTQRQPSSNKMLRFAVEPEVITTNTAPKEHGENSDASWYSRKELTMMKANCRRLATAASGSLKNEVFALHNDGKVNAMPSFSEEFQSRRGLERWSSALNYQSRALDVLQSKSAVFMEQTNQQIQKSCMHDAADILAAAYRENTRKAKRFARALAKADEQAVC